MSGAATNTITRSRRCGLKDIYIAVVTQNTAAAYAAGVPEKFARAVKATITDKYNSEKIYSDDGVEDIASAYEGTDIELEVNALAPQDRAKLWARLYQQGYLVEAAEDTPVELALGFRVRQMNGKYEFCWYYCGKFDQGNSEEYETIAGSKVPKTSTITGSFYERAKADMLPGADEKNHEKHLFRVRVDESNLVEGSTAAKAIEKWFSEVQEYAPAAAADNHQAQAEENNEEQEG